MKKRIYAHPIEQGAGIGLMLVCIVVMLIDRSLAPISLMFNAIGLMIALGLFSGKKSTKSCKNTEQEGLKKT